MTMQTITAQETQNLNLVKGMYEAFGRKDIQTIINSLDPSVQWNDFVPREAATQGLRKGPGEVGRFFQDLATNVTFETFEPHTFMVNGERVVVLGRYKGTVQSTGKIFDGTWVHVGTVRNNKLVGWNGYHEFENMRGAYLNT